ncbi:MAG TPA: peptidoglycan-binding protein [Sedimentibacter sp.]|jgi:peptidoglycan hydrolase-like protein with peptidoglycan-binding domain|nr:peptidoglycan-binding protein [Sedimentibacter sp.]HHZ00465.1 peptidoglycan-binding protein [Tissierellia bacterium]HOW23725.1 peptidoglycan-binding protein [Sedimentibacter sp.]HRC80608.1 peptidoglycan-binding protein [Sedimentibacter sp.]
MSLSAIQKTYPSSPLKLGDDNQHVLMAKTALNIISANYPAIPILSPVNSIFDENMEIAVKEFQRIFDLPETGIIDTATWFKMGDIHASVVRLAELSSRGVLVGDVVEDITEVNEGVQIIPRVQMVQFFLNVLSAYYDSIPAVDIDGIYGPQTRDGIIEFQKTMNLPPTGLIDEKTWTEMYQGVLGILRELPPAAIQLPSLIYPDVLYSEGSARPGVFIIQEILAFISTLIPEIPFVQPDGVFGPETTASVKAFQQYYGLKPNGIVDEATWNRLIEVYRLFRFGEPLPYIDEMSLMQ